MVTLLRSRKRLNACTSDRLSGEGRRKACQGLGGTFCYSWAWKPRVAVFFYGNPLDSSTPACIRLNQPAEQVTHMLSPWARSVFGAPMGVQGYLYLGKSPLAII